MFDPAPDRCSCRLNGYAQAKISLMRRRDTALLVAAEDTIFVAEHGSKTRKWQMKTRPVFSESIYVEICLFDYLAYN